MNDIIGWFFILTTIAFMIAFLVYYYKFKYPPAPVQCPTRLGLTYKPSSNVAPNNIISKVNTIFDDMKPMLCTNAGVVNKEVEAARDSGETCTQIKEKLAAEFNKADGMITLPPAMKKSILDLNNALIDSVCGSDDKLDVTKLNVLGSDIKGMFC